jgi:hypothetical protein
METYPQVELPSFCLFVVHPLFRILGPFDEVLLPQRKDPSDEDFGTVRHKLGRLGIWVARVRMESVQREEDTVYRPEALGVNPDTDSLQISIACTTRGSGKAESGSS